MLTFNDVQNFTTLQLDQLIELLYCYGDNNNARLDPLLKPHKIKDWDLYPTLLILKEIVNNWKTIRPINKKINKIQFLNTLKDDVNDFLIRYEIEIIDKDICRTKRD